MNETQKTNGAVWRRLRGGWPRVKTAASDSFVQAVMEKIRREPVPASGASRLREFIFGPSGRWSLAAAAALALALLFVHPAKAPTSVSLSGIGGEQSLPWEEESSAGYGTNVEEYLL